MKFIYVTETNLGNGEIVVEGRKADGELAFGFRARNCPFKSWRNKARDYTPASAIPVFGSGRPAVLRP
jgi:hypothetical protein